MTSKDEVFSRILEDLQENVSALQIKVGALEAILLTNEKARAAYTRLVSEQADVLLREQKNQNLPE